MPIVNLKITMITLTVMSVFFTLQSQAAIVSPELEAKYSLEEPADSLFDINYKKDLIDPEALFILEDEQSSAKDLFLRGLSDLRDGRKKQGINELEMAWKIEPKLAAPGVTLAKLYIQDKKYSQALEVAEKLHKLFPDKPYAANIKGFAYQGLGHKEQSKAAFRQALKLSPGDSTAIASLAQYALNDKNTGHARELYLEALKYNPDHMRTLFLLIQLDTLLGDTRQVEQLVEKARQKSKHTAEAHIEFIHLYDQLKNYPVAIQEAEKALKFRPNSPSLLFMYAQLLAYDKQFEASRKVLKTLAKSYPNNSEPKELEGKVALAQNQPDDAIKLFQEALATRNSISLAVLLATTQIRYGDNESGLTTFRDQLARSPSDLLLRARFAEQLRKLGKLDEAAPQYAEIIRQRPNSASIRNNLAWVLMQQEKLDEALLQAQHAYTLVPSNPNIMTTYGLISLKKGDYKKAESLLQQAAAKQPDDPGIRFYLSQTLISMEKYEQAKALLSELVSQGKPFEESQQAIQLLNKLKSR